MRQSVKSTDGISVFYALTHYGNINLRIVNDVFIDENICFILSQGVSCHAHPMSYHLHA